MWCNQILSSGFVVLVLVLASFCQVVQSQVCVAEEQDLYSCAEENDYDHDACSDVADAYQQCITLATSDNLAIENCFGIYNIWRTCRDAKGCTADCDRSDLPVTCDLLGQFNYCDWANCCDECKAWIGEEGEDDTRLRFCLTANAGCSDLLTCPASVPSASPTTSTSPSSIPTDGNDSSDMSMPPTAAPNNDVAASILNANARQRLLLRVFAAASVFLGGLFL
jgi:hypothetical protein